MLRKLFPCLRRPPYPFLLIWSILSAPLSAVDRPFPHYEGAQNSVLPESIEKYCPLALRRIIERTALTGSIYVGRALVRTNVETKRAFKKTLHALPFDEKDITAVKSQKLENTFALLHTSPHWLKKFNYAMALWSGSKPAPPTLSPFFHFPRLFSHPFEMLKARVRAKAEAVYARFLSDPDHFALTKKEENLFKHLGLSEDLQILVEHAHALGSLQALANTNATLDAVGQRRWETVFEHTQQFIDNTITVPISLASWISPMPNPILLLRAMAIYNTLLHHTLKTGQILPPKDSFLTKYLSVFGPKRFLYKYHLSEDYRRYGEEVLEYGWLYAHLMKAHALKDLLKWGALLGVAAIASTASHRISTDASFDSNSGSGMKDDDEVELLIMSRADRVAIRVGNRIFEFDSEGNATEYSLEQYKQMLQKEHGTIPSHTRIQLNLSQQESQELLNNILTRRQLFNPLAIDLINNDNSLKQANQAINSVSKSGNLRFADNSRALTTSFYRLRQFFGSKKVKAVIHARPEKFDLEEEATHGAYGIFLFMLTNGRASILYSPLSDRIKDLHNDMRSLYKENKSPTPMKP